MPYRLTISSIQDREWDEDFDSEDDADKRALELEDDHQLTLEGKCEIQFTSDEIELIREAITYALEQDPGEVTFGAVKRGQLRDLADRH